MYGVCERYGPIIGGGPWRSAWLTLDFRRGSLLCKFSYAWHMKGHPKHRALTPLMGQGYLWAAIHKHAEQEVHHPMSRLHSAESLEKTLPTPYLYDTLEK
eukprot:scaffold47341_cov30-Prasinocladus_malaysianus.AAC.1